MRLAERNPHASIDKEPITRKQVEALRSSLSVYWEDIILQTGEGRKIITVGNLEAILDTLLRCKDFDNPQLMMGDTPS